MPSMIRFRLRELLGERSLYWLATEADVHWPTVKALAEGETRRIDIDALERICRALECEPGDLMQLKPKLKRKKAG